MDKVRFQRIKVVFEGAVKLPASERGAYLDAACGRDLSLRAEVEAMLRLDESGPDGFLDTPDVGRGAAGRLLDECLRSHAAPVPRP